MLIKDKEITFFFRFLLSLQFYGWILCQPVRSGGRILMMKMWQHRTEAIFMFFKLRVF